MDALGLELPVNGRLPGERDVAFAELYRQKLAISFSRERFDRDLEAAIRWPFKLIRSDRGSRELFRLGDVWEDPALELAPGSAQPAGGPPAARGAMDELASSLDAYRTRAKTTAPRPLVDDATRELLRELGYTQ